MPGKDGLLHISEMDWKRLETVEETGLNEGDAITVKLVDIDPKTGKFKLSRRALIPKPEGYVERPERPARPPRREGGDRGNFGGGGGNRGPRNDDHRNNRY
ncbi:MAG: S1 RNA-binding domain-containing protein, partial [Tannerella sp.]|jgi:polyribonucleotide nucleotidyltransferase|nr:S1 RNA-binding domain-containing protein [Tannerella sp.]